MSAQNWVRHLEVSFTKEAKAGIDDDRVVEQAPVGFDFGQCGGEALGGPIRAMRRHRRDHVSDSDDSGSDEDGTPLQTVGIPGAVKAFMVLEDHFGYRPWERDIVDDPRAGLGVSLHHLEFRECSTGRAG